MRQEIGLGRARTVARVEVFWPISGTIQVFKGMEINRFYHIREGGAPTLVELKSFKWPASSVT